MKLKKAVLLLLWCTYGLSGHAQCPSDLSASLGSYSIDDANHITFQYNSSIANLAALLDVGEVVTIRLNVLETATEYTVLLADDPAFCVASFNKITLPPVSRYSEFISTVTAVDEALKTITLNNAALVSQINVEKDKIGWSGSSVVPAELDDDEIKNFMCSQPIGRLFYTLIDIDASIFQESEGIQNPVTLSVSTDFCSLRMQASVDPDFVEACTSFSIEEMTFRIAGSLGLSGEQNIPNPGVSPNFTFNLPRENEAVTATIEYTVRCDACEQEFTREETNIFVPQPELSVSVNMEDAALCALGFSYEVLGFEESGCKVVGQHWQFGDKGSSEQQAPIHRFGDDDSDFTLVLQLDYECPSCSGTLRDGVDESIVLTIPDLMTSLELSDDVTLLDKVLEVGGTTYASTWPTYSIVPEGSTFNNLHPYAAGTAGVWRPASTNVYNNRSTARSSNKNLELNGTMGAHQYQWQMNFPEDLPNWIEANRINSYNPEGQETENQDVLGVYSAALFGYGGNYPVAVGNNMANEEMAFTGFEDLNPATGGVSGNFLFGNVLVDVPYYFDIVSGRSNILIIDADHGDPEVFSILEDATAVDNTSGEDDVWVTITSGEHVAKARIFCHDDSESGGVNPFPGHTAVVLDERISFDTGGIDYYLGGTLTIPNEVSGSSVTIAQDWGHLSSSSLLVTFTQSTYQPILSLRAGAEYYLSAWVSLQANQINYDPSEFDSGIRIIARFHQDGGGHIDRALDFDPANLLTEDNPIIEGWKKMAGKIKVPDAGYETFELVFEAGSATQVYFDDLRIYPLAGNMQSYVYDDQLRLNVTLDENNYGTIYDYDEQGQLFLVRKETVEGIKTIQQTMSHQKRSTYAPEE